MTARGRTLVSSLATAAVLLCAVAVDPLVIPLGAEVLVEGLGIRTAEDTGGRIRGRHIDVYAGTDLSFHQANARTSRDKQVCVQATE